VNGKRNQLNSISLGVLHVRRWHRKWPALFEQRWREVFERAGNHQTGVGQVEICVTAPGKSSASATTIPPRGLRKAECG